MATLFILTPYSAEFPSTAFSELTISNTTERRPVLGYDAVATTGERAIWTFIAPVGITGTLSIVIHGIMVTATTGNIVMTAALEAITPADTVDLDSVASFDSENSVTQSVPATAGYDFTVSITLTNADSIAAGDYTRLRITRDSNNASDTATGDFHLLAVEFKDAA